MENSNNQTAGVASIKELFLVKDHVRELNLEFVATKDKKEVSNDDVEPPRKKLKGQNKHRPRHQKTPRNEKLCFKIGQDGSCPFGDSCCYGHDVNAYLEKKPPDLGPECYIYRTFGKCPYSFSCRFASDHVKDGKVLILEDKWEEYRDKILNVNSLTKDLQFRLRRKNYNFDKSNKAFDKFSANINTNKCKSNSSLNNNPPGSTKVDGKLSESVSEMSTTDQMASVKDEKVLDNLKVEKSGCLEVGEDVSFIPEIKKVDFKDKLYLAPLTTVGNLPFRRICKEQGADITCSEMSVALSLLQGQQSEWALVKRHHTEDVFGIQLCGSHPDVMTRCCQLLSETSSFDFIDLNLGCPLDAVYKKGAGCGLMNRMKKLEGIIYGITSVIDVPLTIKIRTGIYGDVNTAHDLIEKVRQINRPVSLITLHGRSREQRYTKSANWEYIDLCNKTAGPIPLFGNGDILSYEDYNMRRKETGVSGAMIARGALIKPWIFKEIKDQQHWDISSSERFDILKKYVNYGLEHWGSDTEGVEKTRRFMLEWLSFLYRYIPVGLLEHPPQRINERPPPYVGRDDLETLMASPGCSDWVKISEMLLGPVPENFVFLPKHKANAYK